MQAEMLDSTVSQLLQDNSAVEYVAPEKNPITTIQNSDLIFGQKHNDIDCALCPTAKRACDRAWVTAKQVENWSKMPKKTLWRWLERIEKARRISLVSYLTLVKSEDAITNHVDKLLKRGVIDNTKNLVLLRSEHGRETTLYDRMAKFRLFQ